MSEPRSSETKLGQPPRVALVTSSYFPIVGGLVRAVNSIARGLRAAGCDSLLIADRSGHALPPEEDVEETHVYRIQLGLPSSPNAAVNVVQSVGALITGSRELAALLRRHKVDVIHVHFIGANAAHAVLASARTGLPLVVTAHGSDLARFAQQSRRSLLIAKVALRRATYVTAVSSDLLRMARSFVPRVEKRSRVIPNGVDVRLFPPDIELPRSVPGPNILAIGSMEPFKGFDVLLRAFEQLRGRWPDLKLVLAGEGRQKMNLQGLARHLGIDVAVEFVGEVPFDEVVSLLAACDLFVMPSRSEGLPIAVLEAMAAGRSVVASRVGGIPDVVEDGRTGLLVSPEDETALAAAMNRLLEDPALRSAMGLRARARVEQRFSWSRIVNSYLDTYALAMGVPTGTAGTHSTSNHDDGGIKAPR